MVTNKIETEAKVNGADVQVEQDLKVVGKPFRKVDARSKCSAKTSR